MTPTLLEAYKILFVLQLLIGEWLFLYRLERRRHFWRRCVLAGGALMLTAAFIPVLYYNAWYESALFFTLFLGSFLVMRACYDEPWGNLLFCGIAGYTVQHLAYLLYSFLVEATRMELLFGTIMNPYDNSLIDLERLPVLPMTFYVCIYFLVYAFVFDVFDKSLKRNHDLYLGRNHMSLLSGLLIMTDVIFNMITNYYTRENWVSLLLERGYNILICILILTLLHHQLAHRVTRDELNEIHRIMENGKKQHELAKKSIDLINMKYHDLRHQSELLQKKGGMAQEAREELDQALHDYAVLARTGNEVLDTILTEKTLLCQKQGTRLTCVVDGKALGFVKAHHLYVLLGNAIDNAMEAVLLLPEDEREISLTMRQLGNMVGIHLENRYGGELVLRDGLPVSAKDKDYHGFGMLSIRTIAEKYGGAVKVDAREHVFGLDIILLKAGET